MRPFGCTIANTKEEDVLIDIYNMTASVFKTHNNRMTHSVHLCNRSPLKVLSLV